MMDEEKLNNDLRSRISHVFDNYEDITADEGWDLLRQKYPPEEKNRGLDWLWYAAAAVLLCLGVWFIQKPGKPDQLMVKQPKPVLQHPPVNNQPANPANTNADTSSPPVPAILNHTATNPIAQNNSPKTSYGQVNTDNLQAMAAARNQAITAIASTRHSHVPPAQTSSAPANTGNPQTVATYSPAATAIAANHQPILPGRDTTGKQAVNANTGTKNSIVKNMPANTDRVNTAKAPDSTAKIARQLARNQIPVAPSKAAAEKAFNSLFESGNTPVMQENKPALKGSKKAMFSVYAATYFNYAKGSTNQMNVGAGFTSDFKISNKLRLSTGVSVGQNTLNYNSPSAHSGNLYFASALPQSSPVSFNESNLSNANTNGNKASSATKLYNANLIGLDIPVNLKYQFNQQSDTYVAAGLSSGTFINETYQSGYSNSTTVENTSHSSFNNFDLAKTLNVSFGVGYPLGKSNRLIVEPFLKYPLDGLGSQQLKFGAGGVNLKLNFQSSKK